MKFLKYGYCFVSGLVFLEMVYFTLNSLEHYQQRAIVSVFVLVYSSMRVAAILQSFNFLRRIERLELEVRRVGARTPGELSSQNKATIDDVAYLRDGGEKEIYIEILFLSLIAVLSMTKLLTD